METYDVDLACMEAGISTTQKQRQCRIHSGHNKSISRGISGSAVFSAAVCGTGGLIRLILRYDFSYNSEFLFFIKFLFNVYF